MIIVRLSGGMGNQMFQYALGRTLSLKYNTSLALDMTFLNNQSAIPFIRRHFVKRVYDLNSFTITAAMAQPQDIPWYGRPFFSGIIMQCIDAILRKVPILRGWEKTFRYDSRVLTLGPNVYLAGFWQSPKYFEQISDVLRKDFAFKHELEGAARALQGEIASQGSLCLHVRRADFATNKLHGTVGTQYYTQAIEHIRSKSHIDHVYVFSDNIDWAKEHLRFQIPTTFVGEELAGERGKDHFALMRACKHFVIPNSTFSWWAAWLGDRSDKIVVAPKKWFSTEAIDDSDLIPENWVRI